MKSKKQLIGLTCIGYMFVIHASIYGAPPIQPAPATIADDVASASLVASIKQLQKEDREAEKKEGMQAGKLTDAQIAAHVVREERIQLARYKLVQSAGTEADAALQSNPIEKQLREDIAFAKTDDERAQIIAKYKAYKKTLKRIEAKETSATSSASK